MTMTQGAIQHRGSAQHFLTLVLLVLNQDRRPPLPTAKEPQVPFLCFLDLLCLLCQSFSHFLFFLEMFGWFYFVIFLLGHSAIYLFIQQ